MTDSFETSRRDFLGVSAKAAALAGIAMAATSAAEGKSIFAPRVKAPKGPKPIPVKPDQKIRVGWIGLGGRGHALLGNILERKDVEIVAVADVSEENRKKAEQRIHDKHGNKPEFYAGDEDYRKLLQRDDVHAVFSALPCDMHGPMYLKCFEHGKHFYGEKPLCIKASEADALVEAQKLNPEIIAQVGFQRRASEKYANAIKMIREGAVGDLMDGRGAWNNSWGPLGMPKDGAKVWLGRRERSGDWMLEQACHTWDVFHWVTGQLPEAACGEGTRDVFRKDDPKRDVTDFYFALLRYPNNFFVNFQHSWACPKKEGGRWSGVFERVAGLKGGIALDEGKWFPRDDKDEVKDIPGDGGDTTGRSVNAFFDCVRTGTKPPSGVENGRAATLTGLLVRKAVDEKRWVKMSEIE